MLEDTDQLDQETEHLIALLLAVPRPLDPVLARGPAPTPDDEPYVAVHIGREPTLDLFLDGDRDGDGDDDQVLTSAVRA